MNIVSLFSGIGGLDSGFEKAGFDVVYAVEKDQYASDVYSKNHFKTICIDKDIRNIEAKELTKGFVKIDGVIGGPPCQSWSVSGKMKGFDDDRGKLFNEYVRIVKDLKPKFFVAENVKGILFKKHNGAFESIVSSFENIGYNVSFKLVNASDFGVAQDRERVIVVGIRNDIDVDFKFPDGSTKLKKDKLRLIDVIYDLRNEKTIPVSCGFCMSGNAYYSGNFSPRYMSRNRRRGWFDQSFTIQAESGSIPIHPSCPKMIRSENGFKFEEGKENLYRRLTVRECARLQGFNDGYNFDYYNIRRVFRMIGNAVPVNLAYEIATSIKEQLF